MGSGGNKERELGGAGLWPTMKGGKGGGSFGGGRGRIDGRGGREEEDVGEKR